MIETKQEAWQPKPLYVQGAQAEARQMVKEYNRNFKRLSDMVRPSQLSTIEALISVYQKKYKAGELDYRGTYTIPRKSIQTYHDFRTCKTVVNHLKRIAPSGIIIIKKVDKYSFQITLPDRILQYEYEPKA